MLDQSVTEKNDKAFRY